MLPQCAGMEGHGMGDKSPKKDNAKKPAKSMKEKRAAKIEKRRQATEFAR
jgi:hypothetical protein